jgi:Zn-dependent M16 (insulinase) family peptidase
MISTEGMAAATLAASAPFTESAVISDSTVGIGAYKNMKAILDTFDTDADKLVEDITALAKKVFARSRLTLSITGKHDKKFILRLISIFPEGDAPIKRKITLPDRIDRGIVLPSRVSYAVCAGHLATADKGARDTVRMNGGLAVARSIIRLIYLWDEVRVKGGAYGSGLTMDRFGNFAFTSYRDPSPKKSLETYRKAPDFLRAFVKDKRDLKEHVIGTAGKMYIPSSPRQTGEGATADFMSGITHEYKQALFDSILSATYADILEAADLLEKALKTTAKAIAGGKQDLDACADVLDSITEF